MNTQNIVKSFVAASTITEFAVVALDYCWQGRCGY